MTPIDPYRFVFACLFGRAEDGIFKQLTRRTLAGLQRVSARGQN